MHSLRVLGAMLSSRVSLGPSISHYAGGGGLCGNGELIWKRRLFMVSFLSKQKIIQLMCEIHIFPFADPRRRSEDQRHLCLLWARTAEV